MILPASYSNGFAPRDGQPLYPSLWRDCVGAWAPCLGPTGLTVRDWSSVKNNAALTNMAAASDWFISNGRYALDLDGTDDYLTITAPFSGTTLPYSFSGWFYFRTLAGSDSDPCLLNSGSAYLAVGSSSRMQFFSGGSWRHFTGTVPTGRWVHLAWVRRATASCEAYINGVSLGTLAFNPGDLTSTTYIGSRSDATNLGLDGMLDSVHIHNRQITPSEVAILALRRGIAYELAPRRRSSVQVAGFNRRRRLLLGST
jgi:hypothetical protein